MIVANASSAQACNIHTMDDELHLLRNGGHILTHWDSESTDPTVNVGRYEPQEHHNKQRNRHNAIEN